MKEVISMVRIQLTADEIRSLEEGTIPPRFWWQFSDFFTNQDELLEALLKSNLRLEQLFSGAEPPAYPPAPPSPEYPEVSTEVLERIIAAVKETMPNLIMDPFKFAEWLGWGFGRAEQEIFTLAAGGTNTINLNVPQNEVWWIRDFIVGDIPSSSVTINTEIRSQFAPTFEGHPTICLHEGLVAEPIFFPGWHRMAGDNALHMVFTNVTGDANYNALVAQEIFVHITYFVFKLSKDKVSLFDNMMTVFSERMEMVER